MAEPNYLRLKHRAESVGISESALFRIMDEFFFSLSDSEIRGRTKHLDLEKLTGKKNFQWPVAP